LMGTVEEMRFFQEIPPAPIDLHRGGNLSQNRRL
jgi:hypothetical protein